MENALYTTKTLTNQALTAGPRGNRITLPVLLPVLLVTLLILSACGGGGVAVAVTINVNPPPATCAANPFGDTCTSDADAVARDIIIKRCIVGNNADSTECANAVARYPCIATPFIAECSAPTSTFATYVDTARTERRNLCEITANTATELCVTSVVNICKGDTVDTICASSSLEELRDFCRMGDNLRGNPNCAAIATPVCASNPLFDELCTPDIVRQRMYCRTGTNAMTDTNCTAVVTGICTDNPFDGICAGTFLVNTEKQVAFCGRGNNSVTYESNCTSLFKNYCTTRAFLPACDSQTGTRIQACSGSIANLRTAGGEASDCVDYADRICGRGQLGGSNPFAPICADENVSDYSATINTVRDSFCANDVFNSLCDGYIDQRVAACHLNGVPTNADPRCPAIIADNCPSSGTRRASCHIAVVAASIARTTDPITFYVEGTADALKLGFTQSNVPANISDFSSGVIRLSDLTDVDSPEGDNDGVGFASFTDSNGDNSEGRHRQQKFYAGLLTGDTLTTRVSENLKNAKWPAKLAIYNEVNLLCLGDENRRGGNPNCGAAGYAGRLVEPAEFTLLVSFDGSTGTIRADGIPVIGDYQFAIDAGFNLQGKIFGNTRLSVVRMSAPGLFPITSLTEASDGTITGKIGQKGLLAAFVSDGVNNRLGEYAGGLVAYNSVNPSGDVAAPDCTVAGTPFHGRCADNDALRIMLCSTRHATAMADFDGNCTSDSDVTDAVCAASGTYANPFDGVICANPQAEVQRAFLANCDPEANISLRAGADCAGVVACTENPFSTACNTGVTADVYASARVAHLEYCRSSVAVAGTDNCLLAVVNCASSSPHANCGDLPTSYCLGAVGRTIAEDTSDCSTRVTARCGINPLSPLCEAVAVAARNDGDSNLARAIHKDLREQHCRSPINANNPDCAVTIAGFCDDANTTDIFDSICRNRVHFRRNVIVRVCDNPNRDTALDNLCNNPHAYDIKRLEHCKTVDFKRAGCGVTVSEERQVMLEITCGDDAGLRGTNPNDPICTHHQKDPNGNLRICGSYNRAGSNPMSPICEIEPQALITVAALCGQGFKGRTIGTIGINPFSAICADDLFNPAPCPSCTDSEQTTANTTAWLEAQRNFCRQDNTRMACTQTIADFCPTTPSADLFDDLCNGPAYLANRVTHCETGFTHAKCAADQMNISQAAAICGTTSVPGTDPFNAICESETLNPIACPSCEAISDAKDKATELARIRTIVLRATQQTFCRASANVGESICADTISRFCSVPTDSDMIFDDLCGGADYTGARLAYCIHPTRSVHHDCETDANNKSALMTLCGDAQTAGTNPFSVACREAFALRNTIDIVCGGGRNPQAPLCTDENAIPAIDIVSITASQQGFCRGNLALPACEETIADFCDFAFDTDVLDPLCSGDERYENSRLITCLNPDISHAECRGTAGIVATLCPTDGMPRHEDCPIIVDHALYRTSVDEIDEIDENSANFILPSDFFSRNILALAGVKNKSNPNFNNDVARAIGYVTDAPATLITGKSNSTGLDLGTLPVGTVIRNGGDPITVSVGEISNVPTIAGRVGGTDYGYALAVARVDTSSSSESERKLYAGLLPYDASDFGAPNFDNPSVGIWNASMNLIMNGGDATASADFDLTVDFISQTIRTHATRLAEFTLAGASFEEPRFTPIDTPTNPSPVVELRNPNTGETYYHRDSRGEDIIVSPSDTSYTDCDGNRLNPGSKIPLCRGDGSLDYSIWYSDFVRLDGHGNPVINTDTKQTSGRLTIDASFSRLGLIHGAINIETGFLDDGNLIGKNRGGLISSAGTLVGRINADQLFAAFASNAGSAEAYAGGFTATPSATPSPTDFIAGGTDDLTFTDIDEAVAATEQAPHPLGITSNAAYYLTGSTTSGFALASENIANGAVNLYAGILTGTNLGNPLFDNGATGTWNAKLNLIMLGGTATADFDLNVDFNTRTIKTYANRPAEFTLVDADFYAAKRSASDSPLVTLLHPTEMEGGSPAPFYSKDTSGTDIVVLAGETINDCAGMPIAVGGKIPLCGGGGNIAYITDNQGRIVLDAGGKPTFETISASGRLTVNGRFSSTGKISGSTNIQVGQVTESGDLIGTDKKVINRIGTSDPSVVLAGGSGVLTGLIGENGLVAAFISDADSPDAYAGGFTALAGVCRIGGTPFDKTACPDTNIAARDLRFQLCIDRDPVAMPFATNCAADSTITTLVCNGNGIHANPLDEEICPTITDRFKTDFVNSCVINPSRSNACSTGQIGACLNDPYSFVCKGSMYEQARTAHLETCAIATAPPDPRCVNLQVQLNNCAVASPAQSCGTLVNDYCLGGAGRVIAGKTTCVDNIRTACTANVLHPRCRDAGVFTRTAQNDAYGAHITKQQEACAGAIDNLPAGATVSDCNTLGITFDLCGTPVSVGTNPFAAICSHQQGNPDFERIEATQALFCEKTAVNDRHQNCPALLQRHAGLLGKIEHWQLYATREVAVPVLDDSGNIKTNAEQNTITKIVQFPINITPAGQVRRDNAAVNYIVGGATELDLTGQTVPLNEDGTKKVDSTGVEIDHEPERTPAANRGGLSLSNFDGNEDAASGFAFASATFATRTITLDFGVLKSNGNRLITTRTFGGTKLYTGLLSGTNVGAPLMDIQTDAEWRGKINMIHGSGSGGSSGLSFNQRITKYSTKDFTLLVSFYNTFGVIRSKAPIELASTLTFDINGRFTNRGVLYGKTRFLRHGSPSATGSLTGLIGANGAVASFISDDRNPLSTNGGAFVVNFGNYAGGFVALPPATPSTAPRADFETWRDSLNPTPRQRPFNFAEHAAWNNKPYFLQGTVSGLAPTNDVDQNRVITTLTLDNQFDDGNTYDGISYLRGTGNRVYAGVLLGTDLGAPVTGTAGTTAQWAGVFQDSLDPTTTTSLFALTVGFSAGGGGTLDALLPVISGTNRNGINGTFTADGIISGQVIGGDYAGGGSCVTSGLPTITDACFTDNSNRRIAKLTGLIGEQGAVAGFITDDSINGNSTSWAGGFVAVFCGGANPPEYCTVDTEDWLGSFNTRPSTEISGTALGLGGTRVFGGFLRIPAHQTGLVRTTLLYATSDSSGPFTAPANLTRAGSGDNGGSVDGVSYLSGYRFPAVHIANNQAFVGILPTTNLGAPLVEQPTTAAWPGFYYDSTVSGTAQNAITFEIDFSMRDINVMANSVGAAAPTFDLDFNNFGVITGMVSKGGIDATARGLIGTEGLVGAFVDTGASSGDVFHGGFVADNPDN